MKKETRKYNKVWHRIYSFLVETGEYEIVEDIKNLRKATKGLSNQEKFNKLSEYLHLVVGPNSQNPVSVSLFSMLCGCSKEQMKHQFIINGD